MLNTTARYVAPAPVPSMCIGSSSLPYCFLPACQVSEPISLHVIEAKVDRHAYASAAEFERDMMRLLSNACLANPVGSSAYGQAARLHQVYLELVSWPAHSTLEAIEAHMDAVAHLASLQPAPFSSVPVGPGEAAQHPLVLDGSLAPVAAELLPSSTADLLSHARLHNREKVVYDRVHFKGQTYRVGDWVHLFNPSDPSKPIVGQIFKVLQKASSGPESATPTGRPAPIRAGQYYVSVCWYHRPEETVHPVSRQFIPNEVFKTGLVVDHKVQDILERCYVMFYTRYIRGRPTSEVWDRETQQLYVSEFRYNDQTHQFNKIKSWNSCIPEELRGVEVPMDTFPKPVLPKRQPSPFLTGEAEGPGFLGPEPEDEPQRPSHAEHTPLGRKRPAMEPLEMLRPSKEASVTSSLLRRRHTTSPMSSLVPPAFMAGASMGLLPSPTSPQLMMPFLAGTTLSPTGLPPSPATELSNAGAHGLSLLSVPDIGLAQGKTRSNTMPSILSQPAVPVGWIGGEQTAAQNNLLAPEAACPSLALDEVAASPLLDLCPPAAPLSRPETASSEHIIPELTVDALTASPGSLADASSVSSPAGWEPVTPSPTLASGSPSAVRASVFGSLERLLSPSPSPWAVERDWQATRSVSQPGAGTAGNSGQLSTKVLRRPSFDASLTFLRQPYDVMPPPIPVADTTGASELTLDEGPLSDSDETVCSSAVDSRAGAAGKDHLAPSAGVPFSPLDKFFPLADEQDEPQPFSVLDRAFFPLGELA